MAVRVYICPWVGSGTRADMYRSKAEDYGYEVSSFIPSRGDTNGAPASPWVMTVCIAPDFSAIAADPTCDDLFAGNLPATILNKDDLRVFLKTHTVSDIPGSRRPDILAVLDKYGIVRTDITNSTSLARLMQRIASTLFEKDDNFGMGF